MDKLGKGWILSAFLLGVILGQATTKLARADGSMSEPLNRIDVDLKEINKTLEHIKDKMK